MTVDEGAKYFAALVVAKRAQETPPPPKKWSAKKSFRRLLKAVDDERMPFYSGDMAPEKHRRLDRKLKKAGWKLERKWSTSPPKPRLRYKDSRWPPSFSYSIFISPCGCYEACVQTQSHDPAVTRLSASRIGE